MSWIKIMVFFFLSNKCIHLYTPNVNVNIFLIGYFLNVTQEKWILYDIILATDMSKYYRYKYIKFNFVLYTAIGGFLKYFLFQLLDQNLKPLTRNLTRISYSQVFFFFFKLYSL